MIVNAKTPGRDYASIGQSIGTLVEEKQAAYGDSFGEVRS